MPGCDRQLIGDFVVGDKTVCEDADMKLISDVRNTITAKMKVLTSYTDAFEMYEYILNRKNTVIRRMLTRRYRRSLRSSMRRASVTLQKRYTDLCSQIRTRLPLTPNCSPS